MADRILSAEVNIQVQGATASLDNLAKKVDKSADVVTKSLDEIAVAAKKSQPVVRAELAKTAIEAVKTGDKLDKGLSKGTGSATYALTNLNRVIQDAPFGIIGIANNIDPLVNSFQNLSKSSGGVGGALKALGSTLAGPTGILFAFSAISSIATVLAQKYGGLGEAYRVLTGQTIALTEEQKKFAEEQKKTAVSVEKQKVELNALVAVAKGDVGTKEQQKAALQELNKLIPDNIGLLNAQNIKTAEGTAILQRYTQAIINQAEAELLAGKAAELRVKLRDKEKTLNQDISKEVNQQVKALSSLSAQGSGVAGALSGVDVIKQGTQALGVNRQELINNSTALKDYLKDYKELADITQRVNQLTAGSVELNLTDTKKTVAGAKEKIVKELEAQLEASEVKAQIEIVTLDSGIEISTGQLARLNKNVEQNINTSLAARPLELKPVLTVAQSSVDTMVSNLNTSLYTALKNFNVEALASIGDIIGQGIAKGSSGISDAFKGLGNLFGNLLKQLGKILIEYAVAAAAAKLAIKSFNPIAAAAAGIALSALGSIVTSKLQAVPFANGGIVTGPTLGLVGEAGQPEVILPLSKLNTLFEANQGGRGELVAKVSGSDLLFVMDRATRKNNRLL